MEPVQMASSLTETFYDLYTGPVHPANHHNVFAHSHPPSALWTPRMDTYSSGTGGYNQAAALSGENANTVCKQETEPSSTEQATSSGTTVRLVLIYLNILSLFRMSVRLSASCLLIFLTCYFTARNFYLYMRASYANVMKTFAKCSHMCVSKMFLHWT